MAKRPNILLVYSDQHRYDCIGANGHPLIETPNLDRLQEEGVAFSHAYCPIPLCVPARSSLLCGEWPTRHLCIANYDTEAPRAMSSGRALFPLVLKQGGYRLGYVGKWHVDAHKGPLEYGFDDYTPESRYTAWRREANLPPQPSGNWLGGTDTGIRPEQSRPAWSAGRIISMLEGYAERGERFFLRWDPTEPHLPNIPPQPYASMYDPGQIPPWPGFPDTLAGKPYVQAQQRRTWKVEGWSWQDWAPVVSRYLGEITLLDAQLGRVLAALDELGLRDDTIVIYTSDHGDMCGNHGMLDKHFVMYEDVVHVPLVVRWPGRIKAGAACADFVSNALDLAVTFCEAAGMTVPDTFQGKGLFRVSSGEPGTGRRSIFATYHGNQFGLYSQRMVRDYGWKYVWNATAEDELYNLEKDPEELTNLSGNKACFGELERMRRLLVAWMEETGDTLLNQWTRAQLLQGLKR